jgi:hypothetical protein
MSSPGAAMTDKRSKKIIAADAYLINASSAIIDGDRRARR